MNTRKKRSFILLLICSAIIIMMMTAPSEADYYDWLEKKYGIIESTDVKEPYVYTKDGLELFDLCMGVKDFSAFKIVTQEFHEGTGLYYNGVKCYRTVAFGIFKHYFLIESDFSIE